MHNTLSDRAYQQIKEKIIRGDYKDQFYTSENQLVKELGMSRTPIREALHRIESEGFLKIIPKKGVLILESSIKETCDFFDLRLAIEVYALRQLRGYLHQEHFDRLQQLIEKQQDAYQNENYDKWLEYDEAFHQYILGIFGNEVFLQTAKNIRQRVYHYPNEYRRREFYGESMKEHIDFIAALQDDNYELAEKILFDHIMRGKIQSMANK
ncbi:MAG: GntR family transcriptional regulator [Sporomusa sp.]